MLVCARIKRHRGRRTSCPSLVNPVRISGPFCYSHLLVSICRELRKVYGQHTVSRVIATGRPSGLAAQSRQYLYAPFRTRLDNIHTCNGLPCVVDDALMVFVRAVREVHAHCNGVTRKIEANIRMLLVNQGAIEVKRRDAPMLTPARRSSWIFSAEFVFGPTDTHASSISHSRVTPERSSTHRWSR